MKSLFGVTLIFALLCGPSIVLAARTTQIPHDEIQIKLEPAKHSIEGDITLDLTDVDAKQVAFVLRQALTVTALDSSVVVNKVSDKPDVHRYGSNDEGDGAVEVPLAEYNVTTSDIPDRRLRLKISGVIEQPPVNEAEEYARSFARTPGTISSDGAVLSGSTFWLPVIASRPGDGLRTFRLEVDLPADWDVVSQGTRVEHTITADRRRVVWTCEQPMEEVYVVAAPFKTYERTAGTVATQVFLRSDDASLAAKYLDATTQYLDMYTELIGPYPYSKFALVENFWETGYGMPSFTLLGSKIIRFPFILTSSYPHEILHNWWGNSVYVDYPSGNWCEGLTAYLADHLLKEGQGLGWEYRRDVLKRYADYIRDSVDFPLSEFRARRSSATEAVGYGKSLMLWHMLRLRLGDERFIAGLRRVYAERRFQRTSFTDIGAVFSAVAKQDLKPFFTQWVERKGAPELQLEARWQESADGSGQLDVKLKQIQSDEVYTLDVPLVITLAGDETLAEVVQLTEREKQLKRKLAKRPVAVTVDPRFDVFRRLHRDELAPTLSELFGAERVAFVVPTGDSEISTQTWRELANEWAKGVKDAVVVADDDPSGLPSDRAVWLLGRNNRWISKLQPILDSYQVRLDATMSFGPASEPFARAGHSYAVAVRNPENPALAVGWIGGDDAAALPGLARKLPHYGKYSFLAFEGNEPTNVRKGQWAVATSPLSHRFERTPGPLAQLDDRPALAKPRPLFDKAALLEHVRYLASPELDGRGVGSTGLDQAAEYVATQLRSAGLAPGGEDNTYFQTWREADGPNGQTVTLRNVVGVLRGKKAEFGTQSVVLGAHYDHLGRGWPDVRSGQEGQPHLGADDNASGVAVLIEVARQLRSVAPDRTIVCVAFSAEEWGLKGSRHYIETMTEWPAREAVAMVNLDTVGQLAGKDLMMLGAGSAAEWVHIARGIGFTTGVKSQVVSDDIGGSDQRSFLDVGVPAVQLFSGAHEHYHRPTDTIDVIEPDTLVAVATFTREAVQYLSERPERLSSTLASTDDAPAPRAAVETGSGDGRRASLGTLPDYSFAGPGVKIERVLDGSAAEVAGIRAGDLLLAIDGESIVDLRGFAGTLRKHKPGDRVLVRLERDGHAIEVEAVLSER